MGEDGRAAQAAYKQQRAQNKSRANTAGTTATGGGSGGGAGVKGPGTTAGSSGYGVRSVGSSGAGAGAARGGMTKSHQQTHDELTELQATVDGLETERDYYFKKLREVEILTQTLESNGKDSTVQGLTTAELLKEIQRILYKEEPELEGEEGGAGGAGY